MSAAQKISVTDRDDAAHLVEDVLAAMEDLKAVLEAETGLVQVGRFREGLSQDGRKSELSAAYLRGLEAIKANAVAIARLIPDLVPTFREAHADLHRVVEMNQTVLATARAVSESVMKGIAEELDQHTKPTVYAPAGAAPRRHGQARSEPLVMSKRF
jgi:hypothetical protein